MVEKNKYDFVDAVRGWAILGVIAYHVNLWINPSFVFLRNIFAEGNQGVQLFFIVSAFTLFLSLNSRHQYEKKPTRNFFIRRLFRIVPLFYIAIVFYFIIYGFSERPLTTGAPSVTDTIATVFFINGWYPTSINSVVPGGWSIAVEMSFYLLLPVLFVLIIDLEKAIFAIFISIMLGIGLNSLALQFFQPLFPGNKLLIGWFLYFWLPSQLGVFCLGILLYFMFKYISPRDQKNRFKSYACLIIALIWLMQVGLAKDFFLPEHFLFSLGLLAFTYALALYPQFIFVNRITTNIGKWSYSMYLIHFAVLSFFQSNFPHFKVVSSGTLNFFILLFLVISITAVASVVTYSLIEKPSIRLGQKIIARLEAIQENDNKDSRSYKKVPETRT